MKWILRIVSLVLLFIGAVGVGLNGVGDPLNYTKASGLIMVAAAVVIQIAIHFED